MYTDIVEQANSIALQRFPPLALPLELPRPAANSPSLLIQVARVYTRSVKISLRFPRAHAGGTDAPHWNGQGRWGARSKGGVPQGAAARARLLAERAAGRGSARC